ncbi:hypothetical protein CYY_005848 [Polysphondylium violaceum]|uniref:DNL-type domain-containing protein n=1 Tax=Polysphondylium violaceum TaxID=133409 RepID=A0A8J4PST2_9MYCE|nr:hypothetical protein CYY_005848 [Polysphondylium violaceum]
MKRFLITTGLQLTSKNNNKLNSLFCNGLKFNSNTSQSHRALSFFNNNSSISSNSNKYQLNSLDKRFYCQKISKEVSDAEVDIHREDDDTEQQFKPTVVEGVRIEPKYYIEFTCTYVDPKSKEECGFVSKKTFSKHSYHKGVVLIRCDGCEKIHLIADHLGFTGYEGGKTIEDFMAEKGIPIQRYRLDQKEDQEQDTDNKEPRLLGSDNSSSSNNNNNSNNDKKE